MGREPTIRWALLGAGIAGRARARAIRDDPRSTLAAVWRGRFADELEAPVVDTLDEALAGCDAVAVCSPSGVHGEQVRRGLEADKHVVVEFPLATDVGEAEALFDLARARERVLHVEHIELLDPVCQTLTAHLRPEWVETVTCAFERSGPEGADRAHLAWTNVARLHRVTRVAGPIAAVDEVTHAPGRLDATLALASGAPLTCTFQQAEYFSRRTEITVETVDGATWRQENGALFRNRSPQTLLGMGRLFHRDHLHAVQRILDDQAPYVEPSHVLHVLRVIDALAAGRTGPVPAAS